MQTDWQEELEKEKRLRRERRARRKAKKMAKELQEGTQLKEHSSDEEPLYVKQQKLSPKIQSPQPMIIQQGALYYAPQKDYRTLSPDDVPNRGGSAKSNLNPKSKSVSKLRTRSERGSTSTRDRRSRLSSFDLQRVDSRTVKRAQSSKEFLSSPFKEAKSSRTSVAKDSSTTSKDTLLAAKSMPDLNTVRNSMDAMSLGTANMSTATQPDTTLDKPKLSKKRSFWQMLCCLGKKQKKEEVSPKRTSSYRSLDPRVSNIDLSLTATNFDKQDTENITDHLGQLKESSPLGLDWGLGVELEDIIIKYSDDPNPKFDSATGFSRNSSNASSTRFVSRPVPKKEVFGRRSIGSLDGFDRELLKYKRMLNA